MINSQMVGLLGG